MIWPKQGMISHRKGFRDTSTSRSGTLQRTLHWQVYDQLTSTLCVLTTKLTASRRSNTCKVGSFPTGLYAVEDRFATFGPSQNYFMHLSLSQNGFTYGDRKDAFEQFENMKNKRNTNSHSECILREKRCTGIFAIRCITNKQKTAPDSYLS